MKNRSNAFQKSIQDRRGRIFHFTFKGWPWGPLFLFLCLGSCQPDQSQTRPRLTDRVYRQLDSLRPLLKPGDLVFRNGTDAVSRAARKFNRRDTSFSHCGIIAIEKNTAWVYHAIGGSYNPPQSLKKELLDSFANPRENDKIAVYRYPLTGKEQERLTAIVQEHYKNRLPFDPFFNFDTDSRMYCSEFVFKSMNRSMDGRLSPLVRQQQEPVYISIDDLFLNANATLVKRIEYP